MTLVIKIIYFMFLVPHDLKKLYTNDNYRNYVHKLGILRHERHK